MPKTPDNALLHGRIRAYCQRQPVFSTGGLTRFHALGHALGWLETVTVDFLAGFDPAFVRCANAPGSLVLDPALPADRVAALITRAGEAMRNAGLVKGWRNEKYDVCAPDGNGLPDRQRPLFQLERACFRRFGFVSHAVHINGHTADGRYWIARRAAHKAIDPNLLDNLAAGGLPTGETPFACVMRELYEEAGVPPEIASRAVPTGVLRTTRNEPNGTHDEILMSYDLLLPDDFVPRANDGEDAEFRLLDAEQIADELSNFTWDAGRLMAKALLGQ